MKRIIVVGRSGAGKSEFSRKLNKILGVPIFHLDNIWWKEDKTHIERDEFDKELLKIFSLDSYIIDGDYSRTYEVRFKNSDTVFFLDYPLDICLKGAESRIGTKRDDIPWKEEAFDPSFKEFILKWENDVRPKLLELISKYQDKKNIIIFKSREEANSYLEELKK